jgi:hypothetical protein
VIQESNKNFIIGFMAVVIFCLFWRIAELNSERSYQRGREQALSHIIDYLQKHQQLEPK